MELKGSQTEINLMKAFSGESQARNRYTYFAKAAKKEGFRQISEIFSETADQEREHAKMLFKLLPGGEVSVTDMYPGGKISKTLENLKAAAAGEHHEWQEMYPEFAETAEKEGFSHIARIFRSIAVAEKQHEKRYRDLAANIENHRVFKREEPVVWRCMNCGYLHEGNEAVHTCPACAHGQSHFEILRENW